MAAIFTDAFDSYSSASNVTFNWTDYNSLQSYLSAGGRFGGGSLQFSSSGTSALTLSLNAAKGTAVTTDEFFFGASFKFPSNPAALSVILSFYDSGAAPNSTWVSGSTVNLNVRVTTAGLLAVYNGATLLATGTTPITVGGWNRIEVRLVVADSGGIFDVHLNGASEITFSGDTFRAGDVCIRSLKVNGPSNMLMEIDDVFIWDSTTRATEPTTWVGDIRMDTLRPSANGDVVNSTPLSGAAYAAVDEVYQDGDTTYTQAATVGNKDLYAMTDLPTTPTTILAVVVNTAAKATGTTNRQHKAKIKSGSTEADGITRATPLGAYVPSQDVFMKDPSTDAAWTASGVNAMQAGWEVVA